MAFIRNCWYMVAWDHEIPADGLFSRTVIGEPVLLYRNRWFIYDFMLPGTLLMRSGGRPVGRQPDDMRDAAMDSALVQYRRIIERALEAERVGSGVPA